MSTPSANALTIQENNGELLADSRVIAAGLGIKHHNFLATLDTHKSKMESRLGIVLFQTEQLTPGRGRPQRYALLTRRQFDFVATLSRNTDAVVDFKLALVGAFDAARRALEQRATPKFEVPTTLADALRLAADISDRQERTLAKLRDVTEMLEEATPLVDDHENFLSAGEGEYSWAAVAKMFDGDGQPLGRTRLLKTLRDEGVLFRGGRNHNTPKQNYLQYFRVYIDPEYPDTPTTVVKPEGMVFLSRLLAKIRARPVAALDPAPVPPLFR